MKLRPYKLIKPSIEFADEKNQCIFIFNDKTVGYFKYDHVFYTTPLHWTTVEEWKNFDWTSHEMKLYSFKEIIEGLKSGDVYENIKTKEKYICVRGAYYYYYQSDNGASLKKLMKHNEIIDLILSDDKIFLTDSRKYRL